MTEEPVFVIGPGGPDTGWAPLLEWLRGLGLRPEDCRRVTYYPRTSRAVIDLVAYDFEGNRVVDYGTDTICTYTRTGRVPAPPVHPSRRDVTLDGWATVA